MTIRDLYTAIRDSGLSPDAPVSVQLYTPEGDVIPFKLIGAEGATDIFPSGRQVLTLALNIVPSSKGAL